MTSEESKMLKNITVNMTGINASLKTITELQCELLAKIKNVPIQEELDAAQKIWKKTFLLLSEAREKDSESANP